HPAHAYCGAALRGTRGARDRECRLARSHGADRPHRARLLDTQLAHHRPARGGRHPVLRGPVQSRHHRAASHHTPRVLHHHLAPASATLMGWLVLGQVLTGWQLFAIGVVCVAAITAIATQRNPRATELEATAASTP